jgi:hypothetical protein
MRKMADQPRAEKQYLELDPTFRAGIPQAPQY